MQVRIPGLIFLPALLALLPACGPEPRATVPSSQDPSPQKPRVDLYGDPLPPGAIARMGPYSKVEYLASAISPDGKVMASGDDKSIRLVKTSTGKELAELKGHEGLVMSLAFSPDGKGLVSGSHDTTVRLWDLASGKERRRFEGHSDGVTSLAFSPDGKRLASAGKTSDTSIRLWDVATGNELLKVEVHQKFTPTLSFSPDGNRLTAGSMAGHIRVWEVATGKELLQIEGHQNSIIPSVVFSPDGKMLASGGSDNMVRLWEAATGKEIVVFKNHTNEVWSIAFSPDGKMLASGSMDCTIRLWELATEKGGVVYRDPGEGIVYVAFSSDGKTLVSGQTNTTILIWDVDSLFANDAVESKPADILWEDLACDDVARAFSSINTLGNGGSDVVLFMKSRLKMPPFDRDLTRRIQKAVDDLNHDDFDVRAKAEKNLLALGNVAEPAIQEAVEKTPLAEMKARGDKILEVFQHPFPISPGEPLRRWRAIQVLERIGSEEAKDVLEKLAKESPSLRERREAKAVLARLEERG